MDEIHDTANRIGQIQWLLASFIAYPSSENYQMLCEAIALYQSYWIGEEKRLMEVARQER